VRVRTKVLATAIAVAVVAWTALTRDREPQPEFQGRALSFWVRDIDENSAEEAVLAIGTNATPYLLRWIQYETPSWRIFASDFVGAVMPQKVRQHLARHFANNRRGKLADGSVVAFRMLGTNAFDALPSLGALLKSSGPETACRSVAVLEALGPPALQTLTDDLRDTNSFRRALVHGALENILNDSDTVVPSSVSNNLLLIAPDLLTNTPWK
jgi:hypothetical protein